MDSLHMLIRSEKSDFIFSMKGICRDADTICSGITPVRCSSGF